MYTIVDIIAYHWVYYELMMACSQVGLISSMDRALHLGMIKFRARFHVKPEFFRFFFQQLSLFTFILTSTHAQLPAFSVLGRFLQPQFSFHFVQPG